MKINKLIIHNIASIENATIDFTQDPLNSTDLYLITGTTGAGKTTILDAICLALYKTTPRLSKGGGNEHVNSDELTGSDSRNIMRSKTGYAFVQLYFTGNDKREYMAEWSVQRGKNKIPTQKLQNAVWSVTELPAGSTITGNTSSGYKEVEQAIYAAVGLDFNQFCRTTMLAQGEFTEFLKSDENEKAEILEKISGTDIYRKIGKEIYKQYRKAEEAYKKESDALAKIETLTPEKRQEKEALVKELEVKLKAEQKKLDDLVVMIDWMNDKATADANVLEMKGKYEDADKAVKTDEFAGKQRLVKDWNETADARLIYSNALTQKGLKEEAERKLAQLKNDFANALSGEAHLIDEKQKLAQTISTCEQQIEDENANLNAYQMEQTITGDLRNLVEKQKNLQENQSKLEECTNTKKPAAEEKARTSAEKAANLKTEVNNAKNELDAVAAKLAQLNLPAQRSRKDALASLETCKRDVGAAEKNVNSCSQNVEDMKARLPKVKKNAEHEQQQLDALKEVHDRRYQSMEDATKKMRQTLQERLGKEDNICPVCGQIVMSIKADEVFAEEYRKIKNELTAQEAKTREAEKALSDLNSKIESEERVLKRYRADLEGAAQKLNELKVDESLKKKSMEEIAAEIVAIGATIAEGEKVETERDILQKAYTTLLNSHTAAQKQEGIDSNALSLINQDIDRLKDSITKVRQEVKALNDKIGKALKDTGPWDNAWQTSPKEFITELSQKASKARSVESTLNKAKQRIEVIDPMISNIREIKKQIMASMPQWKADKVQARKIDDVQGVWVKLNGNVETHTHALQTASDSHRGLMTQVNRFLAEHTQYDLAKLDALNRISMAEKEEIAQEIVGMFGKLDKAKAQYETVKDQLAKLVAKKPTLPEDIAGSADELTIEELNDQKKAVAEERDKMSVLKGKTVQELADDDEDLKKKSDTTKLDKLEAELNKWKSFSKHYGNPDGSDLNRIAQSFVLGSLIKTANHHLKSMAPRYKMLVNPGTLTLKLEDEGNCYETRNTNSISGGESFLVSLALALALADFGQHLGVSTLFIDEGFGTLSGGPLQDAINTLKALHNDAGRQVGIISHRKEVSESIPVQVMVSPVPGTSASTIDVVVVND